MKTLKGIVTSLKNDKTATVIVSRRWKHPLYKKYVKRNKKYMCHVEKLELELGDKVLIQACRPLSKTKHFKVIKLVNQENK